MKRSIVRALIAFGLVSTPAVLGGCNQAPSLVVERLPEVRPDLPEVPQIPPPPAAYPDGSQPVARLRRNMAANLDHDVEVTAYIVEIYQPPECPRGEACPRPLSPHLYVADQANEGDETKRLLVLGYAMTQDEYQTLQRQGTHIQPNPDGTPRAPIDFAVGNKVKFRGRFLTQSAAQAGFRSTAGLLDYTGHETLEAVPAQ